MDFNMLVEFHKLVISSEDDDLRPALKDEEIQVINNSLIEMNREYESIYDLMPDLFRFGGLTFLIQPFYDANKRTIILMYKKITKDKGFDIDFENILKDNQFINLTPVFYETDEIVPDSFLERVGNIIVSNLKQNKKR